MLEQPSDIDSIDDRHTVSIDVYRTGMINSSLTVADDCLLVCGRARQQGQVLTIEKDSHKTKFLALSSSMICQATSLPNTRGIISALDNGNIVIIEDGTETVLTHPQLMRSEMYDCHEFVVTDRFVFSAFTENVILLYKWKKRQPCFRPFIPGLFAVEARDHETAYTLSVNGDLTLFSLKILKPLKVLKSSLPRMKSSDSLIVNVWCNTLHCIPKSNFLASIWYDSNQDAQLAVIYKSLSHTCCMEVLPIDEDRGRPLFATTVGDKLCVVYELYFICRIFKIVATSSEDCTLQFCRVIRLLDMPGYWPRVVGVKGVGDSLWISRIDGVVVKIKIEESESQMQEKASK